jgi:hypothetical protein
MSSPEDLAAQNLAISAGKKAVHVKVSFAPSCVWRRVLALLPFDEFVRQLSAECETIQKVPTVTLITIRVLFTAPFTPMDSSRVLKNLECDINLSYCRSPFLPSSSVARKDNRARYFCFGRSRREMCESQISHTSVAIQYAPETDS